MRMRKGHRSALSNMIIMGMLVCGMRNISFVYQSLKTATAASTIVTPSSCGVTHVHVHVMQSRRSDRLEQKSEYSLASCELRLTPLDMHLLVFSSASAAVGVSAGHVMSRGTSFVLQAL